MAEGKLKTFELDRESTMTCLLSEDKKRLLFKVEGEEKGLTKTAVNSLIDALKRIRDKMER